MVGLLLVSHSLPLALALKETLEKLYGDKVPPVAVAAGAGENGAELGTDATAIMASVEELGASADEVLVLLDLGSAILSAEMALELLDEPLRGKVMLCPAPLVEGAIAAAAQCSIGAPLGEVRAEAEGALRQKIEHLAPARAGDTTPAEPLNGSSASIELRVENLRGLHARPAMRIVQAIAAFSSVVQIENLRTGAPAASARSLVAINCLDARAGDMIRATAHGTDADAAIRAFADLHAEQFGDLPESETSATEMSASSRADDPFPNAEPLSEGIAIGPLFFVNRESPVLPPTIATDPQTELKRLHGALAIVRQQLEDGARTLGARFGQENAAILEAHRMLIDDPSLIESAESFIRDERLPAAHAWQRASQAVASSYRQLHQPLLRERARDVEDLSSRVLQALGVGESLRLTPPVTPSILAVPTLLPSEVALLDAQKTPGIIAESIGATSHAAILLRAAGIAVVDGMDLERLRGAVNGDGMVVALDGSTGEVWLDPDETTRAGLETRRRTSLVEFLSASEGVPAPLHTLDGRRIELAANASSVTEARAAARAGAEAIGLLRTEFLFFERKTPPTENEQTESLRQIAEAMPPDAPITVRTFDIGGDKPAPYLPVPLEANPFLGIRGLRLALANRDLLLVHLRAILRAAHGKRFRVMFPMVTEAEEIRRAHMVLIEAHEELTLEGVDHAWPIEVGMMVEVPAAALNAQSFVKEIDFFSIGTNDLTQYTLAAERGHAQLGSTFADALHPAVLRLVRRVAAVAAKHGKWAGVCGEAAADPVAAGVFIGLGIQELSMGTAALSRTRQAVSASDYRDLRRKALRCLKCDTGADVRRLWSA